MEILIGDPIIVMTGCKHRKHQENWFKERGITYQCDNKGNIWTTDDWLNGKDKAIEQVVDEYEGMYPMQWLVANADRFIHRPIDLPFWESTADRVSGIYFLYLQNELQYVGLSIDIESRLTTHAESGKEFDCVRFLSGIPRDLLEHFEVFYINQYQPPLNVLMKPVVHELRKYLEEV